jgi:formate dehydrogenase maturation protein FdhE
MRNDVDFTILPVGMGPRGRPVKVCPICGRKGEYTIYTTSESLYVHTARAERGWLVVREKCMVPA